MKELLYFTIFW